MFVRRVQTQDGLLALRSSWNTLLSRSYADDITLTWEWVSAWWQVFGAGQRLCVLTAWESGELVGIAPLAIRPITYRGMLPYRRLCFLMTGEDEQDEICSDYVDVIAPRERAREVGLALFRFVTSDIRAEWDEIELNGIDATSLTWESALDPGAGLRNAQRREGPTGGCIVLADSWDRYLRTLSGHKRQRVLAARRLVEKRYQGVRFRVVGAGDDLASAMDEFQALHQLRMQSKGLPGCFSSAKFSAFHDTISRHTHEQQKLLLCFLDVGGHPVAALYGFIHAGRFYAYQMGFDPGYENSLGVGAVLFGLCLEYLIGLGLRECDLYFTSAGTWKDRWVNKVRTTHVLRASSRGSVRWSPRAIGYRASYSTVELFRRAESAFRHHAVQGGPRGTHVPTGAGTSPSHHSAIPPQSGAGPADE